MNHRTIALALAGAFAAAGASAQTNVTLYGLLDAGIDTATNAGAGGKRVTRVSSGGMNTSRWGVRGTEDLGGGLKAVVNLEGGLLLDTGNLDGVLFKRQAVVGLEGGFGKLVLGRSFSTTYDFLIGFDPMGYSPSYSWVISGNASGASKYGMNTAFDNLVKYQGQFGDVKLGLTYGAGEQAGGAADSAKYVLGALYAHGPLSMTATYERVNGNLVAATGRRDETTALHLAVAYETGPYKLTAGMRDYRLAAGKAATVDVCANTYWAGVNVKTSAVLTLSGAVYYQDVRNVAAGQDADPLMLVARARYALSPRTDLYSTLGHAKAKNGKLVGLSRDDVAFGSAQTGLAAGIQHRF